MKEVCEKHEHLVPFFTQLFSLGKEVYSLASKDRPEVMRIWAQVLKALKEALSTPELQSLTEIKRDIENWVNSCENVCLTSPELKKMFTTLSELKNSLKEETFEEAKDIYEKINKFFCCPSLGVKS